MCGPAVVGLKRTSQARLVDGGPIVRAQAGGIRPSFSRVEIAEISIPTRHAPCRNPPQGTPSSSCIQRPATLSRAGSGSFLGPGFRTFRADKPCTRCLDRRTEWSFWNPVGSDRRGPKTHSRRTQRRLGQLRCTRQGLVRESESNTKYGGKEGITGAVPRL
jgi:hypothetical protein